MLVDHDLAGFSEKIKVFYQQTLEAYISLHPPATGEFIVQKEENEESDEEGPDGGEEEEVEGIKCCTSVLLACMSIDCETPATCSIQFAHLCIFDLSLSSPAPVL